ncbi:MAG TPA: hypothetical protein VK775_20700 [Chthoniobacterales bacterium]|nr:hypothetical protein [Chthoniobacterales bacterium]
MPPAIKSARYRRAMQLQQSIAHQLAEAMVGTEIKALVEQPLIARSAGDAPEVDTRVLLGDSAPVGEFVQVRITGTQTYDLRGEVCGNR